MRRIIIIIILLCMGARGQIAGTELTTRSMNSVDVEVCADNVMGSEQADFQNAVQARLRDLLSSTAVYFTRMYTHARSASVCDMFVYQARNPEEARQSVQMLIGAQVAVTFAERSVECRVQAVPWVGEDVGPLGMNWQMTVGDVLLWGGVMGGILVACVIGVCCFVQLAIKKERKRTTTLLLKDARIMAKFAKNNTAPEERIYNNSNNSFHDKQKNGDNHSQEKNRDNSQEKKTNKDKPKKNKASKKNNNNSATKGGKREEEDNSGEEEHV